MNIENDEILGELHIEMELMLKQLVLFFDKNKLDYWIDSGTLLGSVRHKGFIPWDDDIDICMPRNDYNRLINMDTKEISKDLYIEQGTYNLNTVLWTKVRSKRISIIEKDKPNQIQGLFIDIFPVDFYKNSFKNNFLKKVSRVLILINWKKKFKYINKLNNKILKFMHKIIFLESGELVTYGIETPFLNKWNKKDIFPLSESKFGKVLVKSPNNTDVYLKKLYGNDYMLLPPKEERRSPHIIQIIKN